MSSVAAASPAPLPPVQTVTSRNTSICIKPSSNPVSAASPPALSPLTPASLTSKEWVVPPRPKPGRKPATDAPPTKRKAQNRAAQRAFRERRAARVGELEEHIKQMEQEDEDERSALRADIERLGIEVERYRTEMERWIERCRGLESELAHEREERKAVMSAGAAGPMEAVPFPRRSSESASQHVEAEAQGGTADSVPMGCGNCTTATRCQCIDEAFNINNMMTESTDEPSTSKRPHSPSHAHGSKRIKPEPAGADLETDFTSTFAARRPHGQPSTSEPGAEAEVETEVEVEVEILSPSSAVPDPCGFCSDDTPCICAQVAAATAPDEPANETHSLTLLPGISQLSHITPPPSEGDVPSSSSQPDHPTAAAPSWTSGPGTCAQCRADPDSTLFCKSLAASRAQQAGTAPTVPQSRCCGAGSGAKGGECCMYQPQSQPQSTNPAPTSRTTRSTSNNRPSNPNPPSITLTCADAYTTLSRHPGYERASEQIESWMPKLHATAAAGVSVEGRPAMEIDAANVMSVLREFDRRFT